MRLGHFQLRTGQLILAAVLTLTIMFGGFLVTKPISAHAADPAFAILVVKNKSVSPIQSFHIDWVEPNGGGTLEHGCYQSDSVNGIDFNVAVGTTPRVVQYTSTDCSGNSYATAIQTVANSTTTYYITTPECNDPNLC
jgi:hypothetical protein